MKKYTHLALNKTIEALAGHYTPWKEARLKYRDREVLYVAGEVVIDAACCGVSNYGYVLVPGYIVRWQTEKNKDGVPVSEVETITDKAAQDEIRKIIQETERIYQIEFW